jgi:hypothetical protein
LTAKEVEIPTKEKRGKMTGRAQNHAIKVKLANRKGKGKALPVLN